MNQVTRKALIVAMAVGGAALAPMAANAANGDECAAGISAVYQLAFGQGEDGTDALCTSGDRQCGRTTVIGVDSPFLWSGDRDGIMDKATGAGLKAQARKWADAAKIMYGVADKAATLVAQAKLGRILGEQIELAADTAGQACAAGN